MKSRATETFWKLFGNLPADVQRLAKAAFASTDRSALSYLPSVLPRRSAI